MKNIFAVVAASALACLVAAPAHADILKDGSGAVYVTGSDVIGGEVAVNLGGKLTRQVRAGFCGEIRLAPTNATPSIGNNFSVGGGANIDASALPIHDTARCVNGVLEGGPATGGWRTSTGIVFLRSYSPGVRYAVEYSDLDNVSTRRANACGFVRLNNSLTNPLPATIGINGSSVTVSSIAVANPPVCRPSATTPGTSVLYMPQ